MTRIDRALKQLAGSQETARTNAAEASAELHERRHQQAEVDAYLEARHRSNRVTQRAVD